MQLNHEPPNKPNTIFSKPQTWLVIGLILITAILIVFFLNRSDPVSETEVTEDPAKGLETVSTSSDVEGSSPILPDSPIQPPDPYVEAYQQATVLFEAGQYEDAIVSYSEAISLDPESASAFNDRGNAYTQLGDLDSALADYERAAELNPGLPEPIFNQGWIKKTQGEYEEALNFFRTAGEMSPLIGYDVSTNRCLIYYELGEFEQAINECSAAIAIEPARYWAYASRAIVYLGQENYQDAISDYQQSLLLKADDSDALWGLGWANYKLNNYDTAIEVTQQAIDLNPTEPRLHFNLGLFYVAADSSDKALGAYQEGISISEELDDETRTDLFTTAIEDLQDLAENKPEATEEIEQMITLLQN